MAETSNGDLATEQATKSTSPSTSDVKAAIRETRGRLAIRLARTADRVHVLFTAPASAQAEDRGGVIGGSTQAIAAVARARLAWRNARKTGLLRRAAIGAATVTIAAAVATRTRRR